MPESLSRRNFLRTAAMGAAAAALTTPVGRALAQVVPTDPGEELLSYNELFNNPPMLGRVHGAFRLAIFKEPRPDAGRTGDVLYPSNVVPILSGARTVPYQYDQPSDVWFQTDKGWVHSAFVVPSREMFNEPEASVPENGFWAEVTVPLAWQHVEPSVESPRYDFYHYRAFWQQVYKVIDRAVDEKGRVWYRVADDPDIEPNRRAWMLARTLRHIRPEEFAPISPDVENKQVRISLEKQLLSCFENNRLVFQTRIASGTTVLGDDGVLHDFSTAYGNYHVERKRPARRMRGGSAENNTEYDVNAVPWITYFVGTGAAIHGAYWHNNYGYPRSHGCINVLPDAAKWVYRWTLPVATAEDDYRWTDKHEPSTPIIIE